MDNYDFSGWATKNNLKCSDGRTIRKDAFKHNDGQKVPLVWNHRHDESFDVLGHALLENREEGVYAYCKFNDTESGQNAKLLVQHGDVNQLSIYANQLKQQGSNVMHGTIREVSLVLAGANPGAFIDSVIVHGEESDEEAVIYTGENIENVDIFHADDNKEDPEDKKEDKKVADKEKTLEDVFDEMSEEQKNVVYAMVEKALEVNGADDEGEDDEDMKHNVFDQDEKNCHAVLTHADQQSIIALAKSSGVGSLKAAMDIYANENADTLAHGIDDIESLFPDYKDIHPGAPELIERDQSWVGLVMNKAHKSPISRVRTRQADARANELRAKGYNDRKVAKSLSGNIKLIMRTTDPQTVYRRDELHRDDVIDITDFDVVAYQKAIMKHNMEEDIALAALVGDGRDDTDPDKIHENHIRSIWHDEELYTLM